MAHQLGVKVAHAQHQIAYQLGIKVAHTQNHGLVDVLLYPVGKAPTCLPAWSQNGAHPGPYSCPYRQGSHLLTSWESKWRMPRTRREASRTAANASGRRESRDAPAA